MTPFLIDANFFIEAYRKGFPMDVVPSFWAKLKDLALAEKIISIDKGKDEIWRNDDELKIWYDENLPESFFKDSTTALASYSAVVTWAYSKLDNPYWQKALDVFMDAEEADAWLVAFAHFNKLPLVTSEVARPYSQKNIKIPDACQPFGVQVTQPMDMFRALGEKF